MRTYASGVARHLHKPVTLNLERQLFKPASFRLGSISVAEGTVGWTTGIIAFLIFKSAFRKADCQQESGRLPNLFCRYCHLFVHRINYTKSLTPPSLKPQP